MKFPVKSKKWCGDASKEVGNIGLVKTMIDNIDEQKRYTTFAERLAELA